MPHIELESTSDDASCVHVCAFLVAGYSRLFAEIVTWLSPEEQARARRFFREEDRKRFVLGRAVIRSLCAKHLGKNPAAIRIDQTSTGKPYLTYATGLNSARLEFNIAHSGDYVLVAWSQGQSVGVDVEALNRNPPVLFHDVAASAFSSAECAALSAAAPDRIAATFYRIWVRKEAVLKAEGCGFSGSLQSFSVARGNVTHTEWLDRVRYPDSGRTWEIVDLTPAPDHLAALAVAQGAIIRHCTPPKAGLPDI